MALAGLCAVGLAGCGNGHGDPDAVPASTGAARSSSAAAAGRGGPPESSAPTRMPSPRASSAESVRCTVGDLRVGVSPSGGAAGGTFYLPLRLTNVGARACVLSGYPRVAFVGLGDGTQLGPSASRQGRVRTVRLAPGGRAAALLAIGEAVDYSVDQCAPATADGFRVYPPGSRLSVFVAYRIEACRAGLGQGQRQLSVTSVGAARPGGALR